MYWELIDLVRSPEILKLITGSMTEYVKKKSGWEVNGGNEYEEE